MFIHVRWGDTASKKNCRLCSISSWGPRDEPGCWLEQPHSNVYLPHWRHLQDWNPSLFLKLPSLESRVRPVKGAHRSSNRKHQHQNTKTIKEDARTARGGVSEMQSRDSSSPIAVSKHLPTQIGVLGSFGEEALNMEGPHESPFRRKGT